MRYFKHLLLLFFFISINQVKAQGTKAFTPDSVKFVQEVGAMFLTAFPKKDVESFVERFRAVFNSSKFNDKEKESVYNTANAMLKKRMRPDPDFFNYFKTLLSFAASNQPKSSFDAWQQILDKTLKTASTKRFSDFLEISYSLFEDNMLFRSATTEWVASNNNYTFQYDSLPYIMFPSLDLKGIAKGDSTVIYNTSGRYYLTEGRWIGSKGRINWSRTGLDPNRVYADINNYEIQLKAPGYKADSVLFTNMDYFDKPLLGRIEEKVLANVNEQTASYPRFESYQKTFKIKNIVESVDYEGGFSMNGARFIGSGSKEEQAKLTFYRGDKVMVRAASKAFIIRKDRISSDRASVSIYLDKDSIYHPGLDFKLITKDRELTLFRDMKGVSKSPYFNTYHKLDMDFEALYWKLDDPSMNFQVVKGSTQAGARFESANYYSSRTYQKLLGGDAVHPLIVLNDASRKFNSKELDAQVIANYWNASLEQVAPILLMLSNMGFISYDVDNEKVFIKDKLLDYLLANAARKDYDVIEFNSEITGKPNASLSLLNYDLTLRGVPVVYLSDSQRVYVRPHEQELVMRKNRNFTFGGSVHAGFLDFFGKEFSFEYDNFKINLMNVDSLSIQVQVGDKDEMGRIPVRRVKTVIQDVKGEVLIDGPNNKSGTKPLTQYPIFNCSKESFAYYDKVSIQKGAYKRDKFYFKLEPFVMDSLDNFNNEALEFKGLFASSGIFPDFKEVLKLQPDYSLGFVRKTPPGGYPLYGGKSTFENEIRLSHEGLRGDGALKYITSTTHSKDFIFYPDSTNALAEKYHIKEQAGKIEYPEVYGDSVYVHYMPAKDTMQVDKVTAPLRMFNGQAESFGTLFLTPEALKGKGLMTFAKAEMESNQYVYKRNEIFADTADFRLATLQRAEFAFKTNNVNAHVDFTKRQGKFKSNGGGSYVEFPVNQYICFMDQFVWNMDRDDIEMSASETKVQMKDPTNSGLDLSGSQFISTNPKQDSLSFFAPSAKYDLKNNIITAKGVKFFNVADAMLYPDSGLITIEKKAYMVPLKNARVLANYVTQYHNIYNATLEVAGKRSYSGSGYYDYTDETGAKQSVFLDKVATDTTAQTYAEGNIPDTAEFTISPYFDYKGKFSFSAATQDLYFAGASRIKHDCKELPKTWMKFSSLINPNEIYIPVSTNLEDDQEAIISNGLSITVDSTHIYSTFLSRKERPNDRQIISASGFLFYDKTAREYQIASKEKLMEASLPGNLVKLNITDCKTYGEGKLNFGTQFGHVKVAPVGNVIHNLIDNTLVFDLVIPVDFFFENSAINKLANDIEKAATAEATDNTRPVYEKSLKELVGKEEADKLISQISLYGSFKKFPNELEHTILFSDVKMKWDENTKSYKSLGRIGIGSIGKTQLNKFVNGNIEIIKKKTGDVLNIYIELDGAWYYFNYTRGLMQAISSNEEFNTIITELKPDKRKAEADKEKGSYTFMISTPRKKSDFLKKLGSAEAENEEETPEEK